MSRLICWLIRLFPETFVCIIFRALLGREPDQVGMAAYKKLLKRDGNLEQLLIEVIGSDEFRRRQVAENADHWVNDIYQGILGRDADSAAAGYVALLRREMTLKPVLERVVSSDESWKRVFDSHTEPLVGEFYRAILQREPDASGMLGHANLLRLHGLGTVLSGMLASPESFEVFVRVNRLKLARGFFEAIYRRSMTLVEEGAIKGYFQAFGVTTLDRVVEAVTKGIQTVPIYPLAGTLMVVVVPSKPWLVTAMSVARFMYQTRAWKSIVLIDGNFVDESYFRPFDFVLGFSQYEEYVATQCSEFKPEVICGHVDNVDVHFQKLLALHTGAQVVCYADGFRNAAHGHGLKKFTQIDECLYFGFSDYRPANRVQANKYTIIPSEYYDLVDAYNFSFFFRTRIAAHERYSIFFLRYWGMLGYQFPKQSISDAWVETVVRYLPVGSCVLVKESNTYDREIASSFAIELKKRGYEVHFFDEILEQCGLGWLRHAGYEQLVRAGYFTDPEFVFTLDSSLPSIMTSFPYFARAVSIVLGAANGTVLSSFPAWGGVVTNIDQQIRSIGTLNNWSIEKDASENCLYLVRSKAIKTLSLVCVK